LQTRKEFKSIILPYVMELKEVLDHINTLSLSDKLRLYLFINNEIDELKKNNPQHISKMLYYVKNPDKVKNKIYEKRRQEEERRVGA
jgi:hypothetical protein